MMKENLADLSRKELEAEFKKYKEIVDMFSNTVMGGVARMSAEDMHIINATDGYYRMTGYTREESLLPPFSNYGLNLVLPADLDRLQEEVELLLYKNKSIQIDYRIRKKNGTIAWNSAFCPSVQENEQGRYIEVFFLDITQEKRTKLQLASLLDNMTDGLVRMSVHSHIQISYANNEFYHQIGYSREEFSASPLNSNYLEIVHADDRSTLLRKAQSLVHSSQQREPIDFRIIKKNGAVCWIHAQISRLYAEFPEENILQCVLTDITQGREQEQQNLLNAERFRIISEQTRDVIFDWDIDTDQLHYSPVFQKMFGLSSS